MQTALPKLPLSPWDMSAACEGPRNIASVKISQRRRRRMTGFIDGPALLRQDLRGQRERIVHAVFLEDLLLGSVGAQDVEGVEDRLAEFRVALRVADRDLKIRLNHEAALEGGLVLRNEGIDH